LTEFRPRFSRPIHIPHGLFGTALQPAYPHTPCWGDQRHLARLPVSLSSAQARQKVIMPANTISETRSVSIVPKPLSASPVAPCGAIVAETLTGA